MKHILTWFKISVAALLAAAPVVCGCTPARAEDLPPLTAVFEGLPAYGTEGGTLVTRLSVSGGAEPYELTVPSDGADRILTFEAGSAPVIAVWPLAPDVCEMDFTLRDSLGDELALRLSLTVADSGPVPLIDMVLTGDGNVDLLIAALAELGYTAGNAGETGLVYNKYAAWAGDPFGDGELPFLFYCLESAGVGEDVLPRGDDISAWIEALGDLFIPADGYEPRHGDLIFFCDATGEPRHAGIVAHVWDREISAVRWIDGAVADVSMQRSDFRIIGYVSPAAAPSAPGAETAAQDEAETDSPADDPLPRFEAGTYETAAGLSVLRSAPGSESAVVTVIEGVGTPVEVTARVARAEGVSWYACRFAGQSGFMRGDALGIPEPPFPHYGKTLGRNVTVRSALDAESEPVTVCGEPGTELQVTDRLRGPDKYVWFEVIAQGKTGYVRGDMFEPYALTEEQLAEEQAEPSREIIIPADDGMYVVVAVMPIHE